MASQPVNIKKVKAYPIAMNLKTETAMSTGRILKLTLTGLLAEISNPGIRPGSRHEINFEIPVVHHVVNESVVLVKTYDQVGTSTRIGEFHFKSLTESSKIRIAEFLRLIGQSQG